MEEKERRRGKRGNRGRERKGGQDRERFRLGILVVSSGLIFVDVVLVVVEVAAWSSSKGRRGGRGRKKRKTGREGKGKVEAERDERRELRGCGPAPPNRSVGFFHRMDCTTAPSRHSTHPSGKKTACHTLPRPPATRAQHGLHTGPVTVHRASPVH